MSFFVFCFSLLALVSMNYWVVKLPTFFMFTPEIWGRWTQFDKHIFQTGWSLETFQIQLVHYIIQFDYSRGASTTNQIQIARWILLRPSLWSGFRDLGTIGPWQFGWYLLRWVAWRDGWSQDRTDTWWCGYGSDHPPIYKTWSSAILEGERPT